MMTHSTLATIITNTKQKS